jgi:hypothetical protein
MQEAESRASAATGGMVERREMFIGGFLKKFSNILKPVEQSTTPTAPDVPLTILDRYRKYLSETGNQNTSNTGAGGIFGRISGLIRKVVGGSNVDSPQTSMDTLYNLYRSGVEGKTNGGRIGYADGSDEVEIPLLNNTKRLGPEDRISKYQSYSELELLGNIDAKKPNYEILEDYIYRNMPTYEPKDIVPKGARPVMPNEYDRGPSDGILELARGGKVKK